MKTELLDALSGKDITESPEPEGWGSWSREAGLLASVCERLDWLIWVFVSANSAKGKTPPQPKPIRRPGVGMSARDTRELRQRQRLSAAHLAYVLEHGGAAPPPGWVPDLPGT